MFDFLMVSTRSTRRGSVEVYPRFKIMNSADLMIRGGDFYAVWLEEQNRWSTDEQDAFAVIDRELDKFAKEHASRFDGAVHVLYMWDAESGMVDRWHKYCQKQMRDSYHMLDETIIFANMPVSKQDYASKRLPYALEPGACPGYDKLMGVLYSEEERHKIEWAIGSIVTGDSKTLQKFMVLYGAMGTGKSTVLNIIQMLFEGYYTVFDAKALGSSSNAFALEAFRNNPLIAIEHDGDLSRIEDNTRLNSLVSHESMTVNEKFKTTYANRFKCFLFMGTNKPVKITDSRSGLIRRLIDVSPSGKKLSAAEYRSAMEQVRFELGAIAYHCKEVYLQDPGRYDSYIPTQMLGASNDFYNFIVDAIPVFRKEDGVSLKAAWEMYKTFCDSAKVAYPYSLRVFREELKSYFWDFEERFELEDGTRVRSYYRRFRTDKFPGLFGEETQAPDAPKSWIMLREQPSRFDAVCADCPAQYASDAGTPLKKWSHVQTHLADLDTTRLHYVKVPEQHIVIDFDIPDEHGEKSLAKNLEAASRFPPTYAELSKSGAGLHLHYLYTGDAAKLSRIYADHVEVKVFAGNSSLRRKLSQCNDLPIAQIGSGLPLKGEKAVVNFEGIQNEKGLRTLIKRNLNKEIHPGTKPSIDFIEKILEDAYQSGMPYDVSDLYGAVLVFAANSTHQADYCVKRVGKMKFRSAEPSGNAAQEEAPIAFYDVEVFPNLFLVNWKLAGADKRVVRMINPTPAEIEELLKMNLVGFNCRRYDNHILYARLMGYDNEQLYQLSQKIVTKGSGFFGEAYNISYTDVYDFSSKKQSLKKFEIELGIHHQELGLPWDEPVPESLWEKVAEYCDNDVIATEAVFNARQADFTARRILADVAGMTVNDTTNSLTTQIIFGKNREPQEQFHYRDMGDESAIASRSEDDPFTAFDAQGRPIFPGYVFDFGKSVYRGEEVGEGGYVYAEPGMYRNVALLDIASMHPSSIVAENLFGDEYTQRFREILEARIAIKHRDFDRAKTMLGGKLAKYLDDEKVAADLAQALKIAINSVYGLTSAKFMNPFRDPRNRDNIVAKRGALFMVNLKHEVQRRGFIVAHIKTDSIKIPEATPDIIAFVTEYGKRYGYNFEHEATYDRMCLVNNAVYIAKYADGQHVFKLSTGEKIETPWTATGTQFQVPYVFKTLFSKSAIAFDDMCETKSVTTALYLRNGDAEPRFVGKVGQFCPMKPNTGGMELLRSGTDKDGNLKYSAATGTTGYLWQESEVVRQLGKGRDVDRGYYDRMVDEAIETISQYGDFEAFVSSDTLPPPMSSLCPLVSGAEHIYSTCFDCPNYHAMETEPDVCDHGFDVSDNIPF